MEVGRLKSVCTEIKESLRENKREGGVLVTLTYNSHQHRSGEAFPTVPLKYQQNLGP